MADNIVGTLLVGVIVLGVVLVIASRSRNKKKPNPEDPSTTSTIRTSTPSRGSPTGSIPMGRKLRCSDAVYVDDSDFGNTSSLTSELRRDFARYFTSRTAVFLLNCRRKLPAQPIVPFHANVPNVDYVEASNMRTAADFREQLIRELGRHSDGDVSAEVIPDDTLNTAVIMCIRCMTITVGFKIAMSFRGASGMPMSLLQPAFVLVIGAGGRQCHVVTYAYIGQHPRGPPSTKHTDQVLRIQSPNLLDLPSAGATSTAATATISDDSQPRPLRFHFDIYGATHSTIAEEIRANVPLT